MTKTAIKIIGEQNCCSCGLCQSTCPFNAIKMVLDEKGFYKPSVDGSRCTNCGVCSRTCPIIHNAPKDIQSENPLLSGGWSNDISNVMNSSSGGIAFELGKAFIEDGGHVCGVDWKNSVPTFEIATTTEKLKSFRGSKYLQADATGIYKRVNTEIKKGNKVLFIGLPCQVQGISNYIHSNNLFCIDLVCAGVPSMLMYRQYCIETFGDKGVSYVNFRAKEEGKPAPWRRYSLEFHSKEYLLKREYSGDNPFFLAFNSTKVYNRACYDCKFNTIPRRGDLTLCDFWGLSEKKENPNGTSLIIMNNAKGQMLVNKYLNGSLNTITTIEAPFEDAIEGTKRINLPNRQCPSNYNQIFETLQRKGFYAMYYRFIRPTLLRRILRRIGIK